MWPFFMPFDTAERGLLPRFGHVQRVPAKGLQQPLLLRFGQTKRLLRIIRPAERIRGQRIACKPAERTRAEGVKQRKLPAPVCLIPRNAADRRQPRIQRSKLRDVLCAQAARRVTSPLPRQRALPKKKKRLIAKGTVKIK